MFKLSTKKVDQLMKETKEELEEKLKIKDDQIYDLESKLKLHETKVSELNSRLENRELYLKEIRSNYRVIGKFSSNISSSVKKKFDGQLR